MTMRKIDVPPNVAAPSCIKFVGKMFLPQNQNQNLAKQIDELVVMLIVRVIILTATAAAVRIRTEVPIAMAETAGARATQMRLKQTTTPRWLPRPVAQPENEMNEAVRQSLWQQRSITHALWQLHLPVSVAVAVAVASLIMRPNGNGNGSSIHMGHATSRRQARRR
ncbi:hypothetical protein ACLKA7_001700 [Drosophila subpalustris]